jgi:CheY-like chemotaxis protein
MNGFEVLDNLEEAPVTKRPPIIIFTVKQLTAEERERLKGRIARLAQKDGYNPGRLVDMVREVSQATLRDGYKDG